jgi:RNA polymerase sigma-70 factor (ECF subfamily)
MSVGVVQHDEQLIEQFLLGAPCEADSAFEAPVTRYRPAVMSVCRRVLTQHEDAEDAVQETFVALCRGARRIRDQRNLGD